MRYYETIYIVNPNLDNNTLSNILVEIAKELAKTKSKVINHYNWGKKRSPDFSTKSWIQVIFETHVMLCYVMLCYVM